MSDTLHFQIVVIGGGTAGIAVVSYLHQTLEKPNLAIIDPADFHYYQPGWTLVGGGIVKKEVTRRAMDTIIPKGITRIKDSVTTFSPEKNTITTQDGQEISYDFLVVAAGININWDTIPGLSENLGKNGIVSVYDYQFAEKTWDTIQNFPGGTALFTQPTPPFKCPGAAQKIMYLADDTFRKKNVREKTNIQFCSAAPGIFPVKKYAASLQSVIKRKNLEMHYQSNLVEIRAEAKEAVFDNLQTGEKEVKKYDMIHVTPPMSAPNVIKQSELSDDKGWLDVNMHTLQHKKYNNIYGLGDCTNTPNSKTAAAIRSQTPVLTSNLMSAMAGQDGKAAYDGYASCPLITGYGKLILAEFDYNMQPKETFPFDQGKERRSMYYLKRYILPRYYWDVLLKGGDFSLGGK